MNNSNSHIKGFEGFNPLWTPKSKEYPKKAEIQRCKQCIFWHQWRNRCSIGYHSKASSKPCKNAIKRSIGVKQ